MFDNVSGDYNSPRDRVASETLSYKSGEVDVVMECVGKALFDRHEPAEWPSARILRLRERLGAGKWRNARRLTLLARFG